jgi:sec-independent protein translocase protein TatA
MVMLANLLNIFEGPQGIFILLLILLLFGAKRIPELARSMGKAIKEFQKAKDEFSDELHKSTSTESNPNAKPAESTVARSENKPPANLTPPQPTEAVAPGDKADQV